MSDKSPISDMPVAKILEEAHAGVPEAILEDLRRSRAAYQHSGALSLLEMQTLLDKVSYMPDYRFSVYDRGYQITFVIECYVQDTYNPHRRIRVAHQYAVPQFIADPEHFISFVRQCVVKTAEHEAMEWLKWKETGRPIFDPHRDDLPI